jgi:hypothetical protein
MHPLDHDPDDQPESDTQTGCNIQPGTVWRLFSHWLADLLFFV